jgi:predicted TIM-barrel fold metal-dependent hydrolase
MDIVDSQVHLGPGGIGELVAAMDALGIKAALIDEFWMGTTAEMPCHTLSSGLRRPVTPTAELAALTHPGRFSHVARIDRRDPEMRALVHLARDNPNARALRVIPGLTKVEMSALASGGYDEMFKEASDCGLPIFVTIPGNAPALRAAIEKFRSVTFIVDHCGMPFSAAIIQALKDSGVSDQLPDMGGGSKQAEFEKVLRLADLPNVALKWAHAQGLFELSGYPFAGLRPFLKSAIKAFGAERVMWASDVSANRTGESWAELMFWLMDNPDLSPGDRANLLGGTVRRLLSWKV